MIPNLTYTEIKKMSANEYNTMMAAVDLIEEEEEKARREAERNAKTK